MAGNFWKSSHCNQWIWDHQQLEIDRHVDVDACGGMTNYVKIMSQFANLIQSIGEQLKVRQQVIATATIYFKRFYSKYGLKSCDPLLLAPTCLFLASKVEEFGVISHTRLVTTMSSLLKIKYQPLFQCEYTYRTGQVQECEFFLLELMDCCLIVYHPYRPLLQFIEDFGHKDRVLPLAWRICNDMLRTDIPLLYPPHMQALAALYMSASSCDIDSRQWFVDTTVSMDKIVDIVNTLLAYYHTMKGVSEKSKDMRELYVKLPKAKLDPTPQTMPTQGARSSHR